MKNSKPYEEYRLVEVLKITPEKLSELLNKEDYSLVLIYRLLELKEHFLKTEQFEYLCPIRDYFDFHCVTDIESE